MTLSLGEGNDHDAVIMVSESCNKRMVWMGEALAQMINGLYNKGCVGRKITIYSNH